MAPPIPELLERLRESDVSDWAWLGMRRKQSFLSAGVGKERRRHVRVETDDPGLLKILEPFSVVRWLVRVIEVSRSGLGLVAQTHLEVGMLVQIYVKETSMLAVVRHSDSLHDLGQPGYFRIGVEIQHVF